MEGEVQHEAARVYHADRRRGGGKWPLAARAQQPSMPVIGFLYSGPRGLGTSMAGFHNGLSEAGYIEGRNLAIEYRWAHNDNARLPEWAADRSTEKLL